MMTDLGKSSVLMTSQMRTSEREHRKMAICTLLKKLSNLISKMTRAGIGNNYKKQGCRNWREQRTSRPASTSKRRPMDKGKEAASGFT